MRRHSWVLLRVGALVRLICTAWGWVLVVIAALGASIVYTGAVAGGSKRGWWWRGVERGTGGGATTRAFIGGPQATGTTSGGIFVDVIGWYLALPGVPTKITPPTSRSNTVWLSRLVCSGAVLLCNNAKCGYGTCT